MASVSGELTGGQFPKPWWTRIDNPGMPISQTKNNRLNTASAVILLTRVIAKYFIRQNGCNPRTNAIALNGYGGGHILCADDSISRS